MDGLEMRQVFQSVKDGEVRLEEVPCPAVARGGALVRSQVSLISTGTERMLLEFGRASLWQKARMQPDKVRQAIDKIRTDGLGPTLHAIRTKLDEPLPLGYCNVGRVLEVGADADLRVGDRVVSNGPHAELVSVPKHLLARIPDGVSDEAAAFTVPAAIGLQGMRLGQPSLGETWVVTGLGLIGLLTVQLLRATGCRVLGVDLSASRLELARRLGAEVVDGATADPVAAAMALTQGRGVDGVLITAATRSDEPVRQAARMCRKRGRIVLVGVAGLQLSRADFYEKELSFQVSCSYGPGRYDATYEQQGVDYPYGLVRWTEQRNFEAVLDQLAAGTLDPTPLISQKFSIDEVGAAYERLADRDSLAVVLEYPEREAESRLRLRSLDIRVDHSATPAAALATIQSVVAEQPPRAGQASRPPGVAVIGAGNYAAQMLIPAWKKAGAELVLVASQRGASAALQARRHGFLRCTSDLDNVWAAADVRIVAIATRHDSHADLAVRALDAGKDVFVEKPLALTVDEVQRVDAALRRRAAAGRPARLLVGFNRRFAPLTRRLRELVASRDEPLAMVMMVNAGELPADHWAHDPRTGGGRIVGEACHFIDLLRHLAGSSICDVTCQAMGRHPATPIREDKASIQLRFANGSLGTIHYLANGHRAIPKERLEVFQGGRVLQLDNFRKLIGHGWAGLRRVANWRQDKGHEACAAAFLDAVRAGSASPIPWEELREVSLASIEAARQAREPAPSLDAAPFLMKSSTERRNAA